MTLSEKEAERVMISGVRPTLHRGLESGLAMQTQDGGSVGVTQGGPRYLGALLLLLSAEGLRERAWCGML